MSDTANERKVYTTEERRAVTETIVQAVNDAKLADISAVKADYVLKKGKYKGNQVLIAWVELSGQRILGYKFNSKGFTNLSYVLEGTTEETIEEVGSVVGEAVGRGAVKPDQYTTFEQALKKPEGTGPMVNVEKLQAIIAGK